MSNATEIDVRATAGKTLSSFWLSLGRDQETLCVRRLPYDDDAVVACVNAWCDKRLGIDRALVTELALKSMHTLLSRLHNKLGNSIIDQAMIAFTGSEFFHFLGVPYVLVRDREKPDEADGQLKKPPRVLGLRSAALRELLTHRIYKDTQTAPRQSAVNDALTALAAHAINDNPSRPVALRVAAGRDELVIDLGDETGRRVTVDAKGWEVVEQSDHLFLRPDAMLPLPIPERGGSINELRPFMNVVSDAHFIMIASWLIGAFHPTGPYPILMLNGSQGSAKSTLSRLLRILVDPSVADVRSFSLSEQDLLIAANRSWLLAFDNLSAIRPQQADALCRLATGAALGTRRLYTDEDEVLFRLARPMIINGIGDLTERSDLLERAIVIELPALEDGNRRSERQIMASFRRVAGRIFGALLDALVAAIQNREHVQLSHPGRMADFMEFVAGACKALPWNQSDFESAYTHLITEQQVEPVLEDPLCMGIVHLLKDRKQWQGTVSELKALIESQYVTDRAAQKLLQQQKPQAIKSQIARHRIPLQHLGVGIKSLPRRASRRDLVLFRVVNGKLSQLSSSSSPQAAVAQPLFMFRCAHAARVTTMTTMTHLHPHFYFRDFGAN